MNEQSRSEDAKEREIPVTDLFGRTITNIYTVFGSEQGWLDTAESFIELDNVLIIDIPWSFSTDVWIRELHPKATSIFQNLSDYPVYYVNKENKSVGQISAAFKKRKKNICFRLMELIFGKETIPKEYKPYKVEFQENKLKYIQNRKIVDFLWYDDDSEKGLLMLDNGYIITETKMSPSGTGLAGLNYFESLVKLENWKGSGFKMFSKEYKGTS